MAKNAESINENKVKKQERRDAAKKAEAKKSRQHKLIFCAIIVVLALFAALVIVNKVRTSGSSERKTVVASTENFEVTQSMMTFYFNTVYNQYASLYSSSTDTLQQFVDSVSSKGSSYNTLMSLTRSNVDNYLTLAEMAKAAGLELDDHDLAEIDEAIESYKETKQTYAKTNNAYQIMTFDRFLESMFGDTVNESVVRDCLKLTQLASKYQQHFTNTFEYTDEEIDEYYAEHTDDYLYVDYLSYTFEEPKQEEADGETDEAAETPEETAEAPEETAEAPEETADEAENGEAENDEDEIDLDEDVETTDEEVTDEEATDEEATDEEVTESETSEAKANADALAATKTADEFKAYVKNIITEEAKAALKDGEELDEDDIQSKVDAISYTKRLKSALSGDELKEWAFGSSAKAGDTKIITSSDGKSYTVYMLTATSYRDETLTKRAAVIYLEDAHNDGNSEPKANEIKAEWEAGDKSEEYFVALVEKYSDSSLEGVQEGFTATTTDFGEWLYEEGREVGDVTVIHSETNACSYVIYYAGDGMPAWASSVKADLQNDKYEAAIADYRKANAVNGDEENPSIVTFDETALKKVTPITLSVNS